MNIKTVMITITAITMLVVATLAYAQTNKDKIVNAAVAYVKVFDINGNIKKSSDITGSDLFLAGYFIGTVSIGVDVLNTVEGIELKFPDGETLGKISYNSAVVILKVKDKIKDDASEHLIVMAAVVSAYGNVKDVNPLEKKFSY